MSVCIFGAGAIGGLVGARLAAAGVPDLSLVARGAHLAAMRAHGLQVITPEGETMTPVTATDDTSTLGVQDYVFLAMRAHDLPDALPALEGLLGPDTCVISAQLGLPWWYFYHHPEPFENLSIDAIDPLGRIWQAIDPERVLGCVIGLTAEIVSPGVIRHIAGNTLALGEPKREHTARAGDFGAMLEAAGFEAPYRSRLRVDFWTQIREQLDFDPIATRQNTQPDPDIARAIRGEVEAVATALGIELPPKASPAPASPPATGTLQCDLVLARSLEYGAIVATLQELARLTESPTPTLDRVTETLALEAPIDEPLKSEGGPG